MERKKVQQLSDSGSKTSSTPLKNPERVRGERRQDAKKASQEQGMVVRGLWEKIQNGQKGIRGLKTWVGRKFSIRRGGQIYSGSIQDGGVRGESHNATNRDAAGWAAPGVRASKSSEFGDGEL